LPVAARVLLAAFLISVGVGYTSALVQLHMQHASPGEMLPSGEDVVHAYHGVHDMSTLERLIVASETLPFNGAGSMRAAFTTRSSAWVARIRDKAKILKLDPANPDDMKKAEKEIRKDRDIEIDAVREWIHAGGKEENYEAFTISEPLAKRLPEDLNDLGRFNPYERNESRQVSANIQSIINVRCMRCHAEGKQGVEGEIHLDKFDVLQDYLKIEYGGGMPLRKLAQSTHVHLLGFAMLYAFTGLIFSMTSYPAVVRLMLAPFPLLMQLVDISFWWLARLPDPNGPLFAQGIRVTGGLVAAGLMAHIVLGSFDLFGKKGKLVLILLFAIGAGLAGMVYSTVIDPYLLAEGLQGGPAGE
jgi:hypothetical protein